MVAHVIDAQTGMPFSHASDVMNVFSRAANTRGIGRFDSATGRVTLDAQGFDRYRQRLDAQTVRTIAAEAGRNDALQGAAGGLPRDFEHIYNEILLEERQPNNFQKLFQMDRRVPLGARTHTVRRRMGSGDVAIYRGGNEVPRVRGSVVEEEFRVLHLVTAVEVDWFEMISDSFAGRNAFADDSRDAIRFIEERTNTIAFDGEASLQVFGFLNYPTLAASVSSVSFTAAAITAAPAATRAELNRLANFAIETSGGTFRPTRFATSIRIRNRLMQIQNSTASDRSVGATWLDGHETINAIEGVRELRAIGPNGEDGLIFYDDALQSTAFVMIQPPTPMPAHAINAFRNQVVYVSTLGGMVMRNVGNNLLAFAPA